jgi:hypothetical protein
MEPTVKAWYMMHHQCILHEHEHVDATAAMVAPTTDNVRGGNIGSRGGSNFLHLFFVHLRL